MNQVNAEITPLKEGLPTTKDESCSDGNFLSTVSLSRRKKSPTSDGQLSAKTRKRRAKETYQAALQIHGGSEGCSTPVAVGLIDTLGTKFSKDTVTSLICKRVSLAKKITRKFHKEKCRHDFFHLELIF